MTEAMALMIIEGIIFVTDQIWKINEKLERIGAQDTEETKKLNIELKKLRNKLTAEVTKK